MICFFLVKIYQNTPRPLNQFHPRNSYSLLNSIALRLQYVPVSSIACRTFCQLYLCTAVSQHICQTASSTGSRGSRSARTRCHQSRRMRDRTCAGKLPGRAVLSPQRLYWKKKRQSKSSRIVLLPDFCPSKKNSSLIGATLIGALSAMHTRMSV